MHIHSIAEFIGRGRKISIIIFKLFVVLVSGFSVLSGFQPLQSTCIVLLFVFWGAPI